MACASDGMPAKRAAAGGEGEGARREWHLWSVVLVDDVAEDEGHGEDDHAARVLDGLSAVKTCEEGWEG